jgi:hypothetical protein
MQDTDDAKRKRKNARTTAWLLAAMALGFFLLTIFRMGGQIANRGL